MEANNNTNQPRSSDPKRGIFTIDGVEFDAVCHEINEIGDFIKLESDERNCGDGLRSDPDTIKLSLYTQTEHSTTVTIYKVPYDDLSPSSSIGVYSIYNINSIIEFDGPDRKIVIMPPNSIIVFGSNGSIKNATVLSNHTMVVNIGDATSDSRGGKGICDEQVGKVDIIGKIYNVQNQEITIKGDVIPSDCTPLLYNYIPHVCASYQYDDNCINHLTRRARNIGLTECILLLGCIYDTDYENNGHVIGGWAHDTTPNSPEDLAKEAFINRLKVRAVKFHSNHWDGSFSDFFDFIYDYVDRLRKEIRRLNNDYPNYAVDVFNEVYIINERPDWTNCYCKLATEIRSHIPSTEIQPTQTREDPEPPDFTGLTWHISYAGRAEMTVSSPEYYDVINPELNFYPRLTIKQIDPTWNDTQLDAFIQKNKFVEQVLEYFTSMGAIWDGTKSFDGSIALSETGCCPNARALIKSAGNPNEEIGIFQENVMPLYWKIICEVAKTISFKYIVVFYHNWIYDDSRRRTNNVSLDGDDPKIYRENANLVERMYNVFKNFRNSYNQTS